MPSTGLDVVWMNSAQTMLPVDAVSILAASADAGLHLRFHLAHRLIHRRPESIEDVLVAAHRVEQRNALGHGEGEIIADRAFGPRPDRQLLAGSRVKVIAEPIEGVLIDRPGEPQAGRTFAAPGTDEFLSLRCSSPPSSNSSWRHRHCPVARCGSCLILAYHQSINEKLTILCSTAASLGLRGIGRLQCQPFLTQTPLKCDARLLARKRHSSAFAV